jgi:hypothetical protein
MTGLDTSKIYVLIDPLDGEIRYVGVTTVTLESRLSGHIGEAAGGIDTYKCRWIRKLVRLGFKPTIVQLCLVKGESWSEVEVYWIAYFKTIGCPLTNATEGGQGHKITQEIKDKISLAQKGKPKKNPNPRLSSSHKNKIRQATSNSWKDPVEVEKKKQGMRKIWQQRTAEERLRITNAGRMAMNG